MNTQIWLELLDFFAFTLVTTDLLGKERLERIRGRIESKLGAIAASRWSVFAALAGLALVLAVVLPSIMLFYEYIHLVVEHFIDVGWPSLTFGGIKLALAVVAVVSCVLGLIVAVIAVSYDISMKFARKKAYRIALAIGAILFICARIGGIMLA